MALVRIGGHLASKTVVLTLDPDAMPGSIEAGSVTSLGTFEHAFGPAEVDDVLPGSPAGVNHVITSHVWEILRGRSAANLSTTKTPLEWPEAVTDPENWTIIADGEYMEATGLYSNGVLVRMGTTPTLVTTHLPSGTTVVVGQLDFASSDTGVATVSSIGVVTPVAPGRADITITRKDKRFSTVAPIKVEAAELTATRSAQGAGALGDYEYSWTLAGGVGPFTIKLGTADPIPYVSGDALDVVSAGSKTVVIKDTGDSVSPQQTVTQTFTATTP
jgi:hypothetical protein